MTLFLGIDVGVAGAYALIAGDGQVQVIDDLPIHQAQHGRTAKQRAELDLHAFQLVLSAHRPDHVFLEAVTAWPKQGITSTFRFGHSAGSLYGLVVGLGLAVTLVPPKVWQRHHGIGPSPDAARQRAVQLYPSIADRLGRKRDAHRADALLIADYGLRRQAGPQDRRDESTAGSSHQDEYA
jgi:crossover junction endodeoxyribonuclease RuvC